METGAIMASTLSGLGGIRAAMPSLGRQEFLQLLVAQLRNQDPLSPMDDQDFIAQLAQLNSLEQLAMMNDALTALLITEQFSQASTLIGKHIETFPDNDDPVVRGLVSEVRIEEGRVVLIVGGEQVSLGDIARVWS